MEELKRVSFYNQLKTINENFEKIEEAIADSDFEQASPITLFSGTANLPTPAATYADLAAARAYDESLRAASESRLDNIEAKINLIIQALRSTGIIAT